MPILKNAKKKILVDRKRAVRNKVTRSQVASAIKRFKKEPSVEALSGVFSTLDKAAKKDVFHTGKADRLKSRLSKLVKVEAKEVKKEVKKTAKKAVKKVAKKTSK